MEFQDGTRKVPTQDYHGSGRPHVHVLVFACPEAVQSMSLTESISATMPPSLMLADGARGAEGAEGADAVEDAISGLVGLAWS